MKGGAARFRRVRGWLSVAALGAILAARPLALRWMGLDRQGSQDSAEETTRA